MTDLEIEKIYYRLQIHKDIIEENLGISVSDIRKEANLEDEAARINTHIDASLLPMVEIAHQVHQGRDVHTISEYLENKETLRQEITSEEISRCLSRAEIDHINPRELIESTWEYNEDPEELFENPGEIIYWFVDSREGANSFEIKDYMDELLEDVTDAEVQEYCDILSEEGYLKEINQSSNLPMYETDTKVDLGLSQGHEELLKDALYLFNYEG